MKKLHFYIVLSLLTCGIAAPAVADDAHPTIHHAITSLEATKADLQAGEHGFGGHRSKAIEHIDAALAELNQALAYANDHPEEVKAPGK